MHIIFWKNIFNVLFTFIITSWTCDCPKVYFVMHRNKGCFVFSRNFSSFGCKFLIWKYYVTWINNKQLNCNIHTTITGPTYLHISMLSFKDKLLTTPLVRKGHMLALWIKASVTLRMATKTNFCPYYGGHLLGRSPRVARDQCGEDQPI
jgi:hypothetical protein